MKNIIVIIKFISLINKKQIVLTTKWDKLYYT